MDGFDLKSPLVCEGIIGDGCGGGRLFYVEGEALRTYDPNTKNSVVLLEKIVDAKSISKTACIITITTKINDGDLTSKPGWVRMSIHPTMTDKEVHYIMNAIEFIAKKHDEIGKDYSYNGVSNEFIYKEEIYAKKNKDRAISWFEL